MRMCKPNSYLTIVISLKEKSDVSNICCVSLFTGNDDRKKLALLVYVSFLILSISTSWLKQKSYTFKGFLETNNNMYAMADM